MTATIQILLVLLAVLVAAALIARRLNTAPSIVLVLAGVALALVPGLPPIELAPELVLLVILPPLIYSASVVPEISDRIVEIDRAMRWGYAHALGPFELWDALDFPSTARRIVGEGGSLPSNVEKMMASGATSFYRHSEYFDLAADDAVTRW